MSIIVWAFFIGLIFLGDLAIKHWGFGVLVVGGMFLVTWIYITFDLKRDFDQKRNHV